MKANIPNDWDEVSWTSICIEWPNSDAWLAILSGLIAMPSRGRNWTRESGTITDAIAIGKEIWSRYNPSVLGCGDEMDVRQNPSDPCILDKDVGEGWTQFADLALCAAQMAVNPPYTGPDFDWSEDTCLDAYKIAHAWYDLFTMLATDRSSSSSQSELYVYASISFATAKVVPVNSVAFGSLISALWAADADHLNTDSSAAMLSALTCAVKEVLDDQTGITFTDATEIADAVAAWAAVYGWTYTDSEAVALALAGCLTAASYMSMFYNSTETTWDCSEDCPGYWCYVFDFTLSDDGIAGNYTWVDGVGLQTALFIDGSYYARRVAISINITDATRLQSMSIDYTNYSAGDGAGTEFHGIRVMSSWVETWIQTSPPPNPMEWDGDIEVASSSIGFVVLPGVTTNHDPGGQVTVTRLTLRGYGINPFGEDNCP